MERTKRLVAIIAAGALLFGCGGSGPEAEPTDAVPSDNPNQPVEEVDYHGFTVAPPVILEDGTPKHTFDEKLNEMVETTEVPSTLGGAFFQLGRAYLSGREPLTQIEMEAFEIFDNASSETLQALDRTLKRIDDMPEEDMATIYNAGFLYARSNVALTHSQLGNALTEEVKQRTSLSQFGDPSVPLDEGRAGLVRAGECYTVDAHGYKTPGYCPTVCGVKTEAMGKAPAVRTRAHIPELSVEDYDDRELSEATDCLGDWVRAADGTTKCLRVPTVRSEEIVRLEGINFHDVDTQIELMPWYFPADELDRAQVVQVHVRGYAPNALERARWNVYKPGDNVTQPVHLPDLGSASEDQPSGPPGYCTALDVIHFRVPAHTKPGVYKIQVTNENPDPLRRGELSNTGQEPFIQVLSPETTDFTVSIESLVSTWNSDVGRDEIGFKFYLLSKGHLGMSELEIGKVGLNKHKCVGETDDEGNCTPATLFSTTNKDEPIDDLKQSDFGLAFAIVGLEIDDREAYEKEIRDWDTLYALVSKRIYGKVADYVGKGVGYGVTAFTGSKVAGEMIGKALTEGIKSAVTLWAPADLIIADRSAYSFSELDALTSDHLTRLPEPYSYTVADKVDVRVEACSDREERYHQAECFAEAKGEDVYREIREYDVRFNDKCKTEFCSDFEMRGDLHWLNLRFDRIN